jgi:hypothetical protein
MDLDECADNVTLFECLNIPFHPGKEASKLA